MNDMNCELLRQRLASDPARADDEFDRHARSCAACAAFRQRLERSEALIQKALRFDVAAARREAVAAGEAKRARSSWPVLASGIAAGLAIGLVVWSVFSGPASLTPEALAAEVARHWYHEPESWIVSNVEVSDAVLARVLDGRVELDLSALTAAISYAESCRVGGQQVPHLVVQGEQGPYMVLLMPGRMLESPVPVELADEGLRGHVVPAGGGAIAVLGGGDADNVEEVEAMVLSAVNWSI
jgi:hypothetical protein